MTKIAGVAPRRLAGINKTRGMDGDASEPVRSTVKLVSRLFAGVLVVLGIALAAGGGWLIGLR